MDAYELRNSFNLKEYNTAITREEFEANFNASELNNQDGYPFICAWMEIRLSAEWA